LAFAREPDAIIDGNDPQGAAVEIPATNTGAVTNAAQ
jgi:hypothetical protein